MILKEAIKDAYITQDNFAVYCRVNLRTVQRWCNHDDPPFWVWELALKLIVRNNNKCAYFWEEEISKLLLDQ